MARLKFWRITDSTRNVVYFIMSFMLLLIIFMGGLGFMS